MSKIKLSVVLATHNEERNLGKCLNSVKDIADEIVIADESSTDKTVEIAKKYQAKFISATHQNNFHISKNIAIDNAKGDWILQLDADEEVSPELAEEIKKIINNQPARPVGGSSMINGYWVNRRNWFLNRFLTKGGQYPDPTLRLYRHGKGRLPAKDVHEQAVVEGKVGHLKNDLLHYRDTSFEKYLQGFNRYSSFVASQLKSSPNSVSFMLIKPLITFFKIYFRHRGYVDGFEGFVFALYSALIFPVAYIKYWQITKFPS